MVLNGNGNNQWLVNNHFIAVIKDNMGCSLLSDILQLYCNWIIKKVFDTSQFCFRKTAHAYQHTELNQNILNMIKTIFTESKSLPEDETATSEEQFFQPEPYQQEETSSDNSFENFSEKSENSNLWQNLMDAPKKNYKTDVLNSDISTSTLGIATDRMDDGEGTKQVSDVFKVIHFLPIENRLKLKCFETWSEFHKKIFSVIYELVITD